MSQEGLGREGFQVEESCLSKVWSRDAKARLWVMEAEQGQLSTWWLPLIFSSVRATLP